MGSGVNRSYRPKIYIHAPYQPEPAQAAVKRAILDQIGSIGFDAQEFQVSGIPKGDAWSFGRAMEVMRQCDGALILALKRGTDPDGVPAPSEYSHFEGALALSCNLPTFVIAEQGMSMRGILAAAGGSFVLQIPMQDVTQWLSTNRLSSTPAFHGWVEKVNSRHDVFFGYCSKADNVARNIKAHLEQAGLRVLDWATDFQPGHTIMEEVARATRTSRCGLFLFTTDDPIEGSPTSEAIPRDNVLLEAGYFMNAHTTKRMVVVREKGTKMPVDLGGMIYLTLNQRNGWKAVAEKVVIALRKQMNMEAAADEAIRFELRNPVKTYKLPYAVLAADGIAYDFEINDCIYLRNAVKIGLVVTRHVIGKQPKALPGTSHALNEHKPIKLPGLKWELQLERGTDEFARFVVKPQT